jgi:ABC-type multidrug transport system ATPase subunit
VKIGELIGFFGHNGSDKKTLFNIIVGKLSMSSGTITFFGQKKK